MFAEGTKWASPAVAQALPAVTELCRKAAARTIFTRFLTPKSLEGAHGRWRCFYEESPSLLGENLDPDALELVQELRRFTPPAHVVDRYVYSAFAAPALSQLLAVLGADTAIISGVESDVCVLATTLSAIDRGYRLVMVKDAIASSNSSGHKAVLEGVFARFDQQVELVKTETVLQQWKPVSS